MWVLILSIPVMHSLEHYNKYHELPYGFANTTPGNGHLNEVGHKIMADVIIDYLEEVDCK